MNKITVHIQMERVGGNIPTSKIDEMMDKLNFIMEVSDVSFESDWLCDTSRITYKGKLRKEL